MTDLLLFTWKECSESIKDLFSEELEDKFS